MGKSTDTSPRKVREIRTLLIHTSHSQREIATITGVSKSVVNRIKIKIDENLPLEVIRNGRCGRKKITTPRGDRKIRDVCLQNRKMSVDHITRLVNEGGINVSKRTVQRRLAEENLIGHRPAKKPRLTQAMKKKRLKWAKEHRNMTVEDWSRVSMTSMAYICLNNCFIMTLLLISQYLSGVLFR